MDNKFVDGFFVKAPRAGAPDFVKGSVSLKREEFMRWVVCSRGRVDQPRRERVGEVRQMVRAGQ